MGVVNLSVAFSVLVGLLVWPAESVCQPRSFWDTWSDGKAEVSTYKLVQPRYGELRMGKVVLIYVAQPFLWSKRVKPEPGPRPKNDLFYVLKLNHLRTFQTGVYPYRIMTSTFVHVDPTRTRDRGATNKIAFSSQEWCGTTFQQLLFEQESVRSRSFSYFEKEADQEKTLPYPKDSLIGDSLFITLRGTFGELIKKGQNREFAYLPTLTEVRLAHKPLVWSAVKISRGSTTINKEVKAGTFECDEYSLVWAGRPTLRVLVETNHPHRIIGWLGSDGEQAELVKSERIKYWELIRNQDQGRY